MNRTDTKKADVPYRLGRLRQHLIEYYESFLLHFVLGVSAVCTMFFCMLRFLTMTENGAFLAFLSPETASNNAEPPRSIACFLLESSVYCTSPGVMMQAFPGETFPPTSEIPSVPEAFSPEPEIPSVPEAAAKTAEPPQAAAPDAVRLPSETEAEALPSCPETELVPPQTQEPPITWEQLYASPENDLPKGERAVLPTDLSQSHLFSDGNGSVLFSNQTSRTVSARELLAREYPISVYSSMNDTSLPAADEPLVLILHTHGTEAYAPEGAASVSAADTARSEDITQNVVSVGSVLAESLTEAGIPVLHCETMFDAASYTMSYQNAAAYIRKTVEQYPSIRYIFDVHRDALETADGSVLRPVTLVGTTVSAQVMCVVGTDEAGADHPNWTDNLTVAVQLQTRLNQTYERFARPINVRSAGFNGQYAPGAMILEIGSSGNSLREAQTAAKALGTVLAEMILSY